MNQGRVQASAFRVVKFAFIVESWYPGFERLPIGLGDPKVGSPVRQL
jgi:hypothetical protein